MKTSGIPFTVNMDKIMRENPVETNFVIFRMICGTLRFLTITFPDLLGSKLCMGLSMVSMWFSTYKIYCITVYEAIPTIKTALASDYLHRFVVDPVCNFFLIDVVNFYKSLFEPDHEEEYKNHEPVILDSYPNKFFANATYCDEPNGRYLNRFDKGRCELDISSYSHFKQESLHTEEILLGTSSEISSGTLPEISPEASDESFVDWMPYIKMIYDFRNELFIGAVILIWVMLLISKRKSIVKKLRLATRMAQKQTENKIYSKTPYLREVFFGISFIFSLFCVVIANICRITDREIPRCIYVLINPDEVETSIVSRPTHRYSDSFKIKNICLYI